MPRTITNQIKFLTPFDVPCAFGAGYPFLLKFITPQSTIVTALPTMLFSNINESGTEITVGPSFIPIEGIDVYYPAGVYLNPVLPLPMNTVSIILVEEPFKYQISETKQVENVCVNNYTNPICLVWLNSLGGWDVWVFNKPENTTQIKGENYITRPIDSLDAKELGTLITRNETKSIIVSQNSLNENRYKCLQEIAKSPQCYIYYNANDFEQVQVSQSTFTQKTANELFTINLEVSFFKIYNQF